MTKHNFEWPGVTCLALDLGTKTGIAYNQGTLQATTLELGSAKETKAASKERLNRRRDPRVVRLYDTLKLSQLHPDIVVFEDVEFQSYTLQCQLWSSFRTAAWLAFPKAHFECVPVGTLKKFATGHGGATKEMMARALGTQYPEAAYFTNLDDNAIDAIWLWLWARENLARLDFSKLKGKV